MANLTLWRCSFYARKPIFFLSTRNTQPLDKEIFLILKVSRRRLLPPRMISVSLHVSQDMKSSLISSRVPSPKDPALYLAGR